MRKMLIPLLLFALLLSFAALPAAAAGESPFREDFALLWRELEESYPYLPLLEAKGIPVSQIRERYAQELDGMRDEADFAVLLQRMLAELGNFAHLELVSPSLYESLYAIYLLDPDVGADPASAPFREVLTDPRLSDRYVPPEGAREENTGASLPAVTVLYYPDCRALHLKLSSFRQEIVARDADVLAEALEKYPEAEHIILDITGNTGGSDWYWMRNLVAPFGGNWDFSYRVFSRDTEIRRRFYPAGTETRPISELDDVPDWAAELGMNQAFILHATLPGPEDCEGRRSVQSGARRWLLVDRAVFSASEKFACFCKESGWATLVGTRTSGDGLNTTPVLLLLPDSGLLIRFSADAGEGSCGTINADAGTVPDILCKRGELPLSRCLEEIRSLEDGS